MAAPESTAGTTNQVTRDVDDGGLAVAPLLAGSLGLFLVAFVILIIISWACRRRDAARRDASSSAAAASAMPPSLDADAINGLPVTLYNPARSTGEKGIDEREAECSICISTLVAGDKMKVLPPCGHCFHPDCVDAWLRSHPSCPLCRTLLLTAGAKPVDAVNRCEDNSRL